jgi:hypothetical protein
MSEIVDRAALRLAARLQGEWDVAETESQLAIGRDLVRIVLEAVREPTEWRADTPEGTAIMALRHPAYVAACRQTNCADRGFDEATGGECAFCADLADEVIETHSKSVVDTALKE